MVYGTNTYYFLMSSLSAAADNTFGIQVGTQTSPPAIAITDYVLGALIANGNGNGQVVYSATTLTAPATVGSTRKFTIARTFTNNYSSNITINEIGLVLKSYYTQATAFYYMIEHSYLTFTINSGGASATVTYTISSTV